MNYNHGKEENKAAGETARSVGAVRMNPVEDKSVFKENHIIFQIDKGYIGELFGMIC